MQDVSSEEIEVAGEGGEGGRERRTYSAYEERHTPASIYPNQHNLSTIMLILPKSLPVAIPVPNAVAIWVTHLIWVTQSGFTPRCAEIPDPRIIVEYKSRTPLALRGCRGT